MILFEPWSLMTASQFLKHLETEKEKDDSGDAPKKTKERCLHE